jgi:hypothetical protein
LLLIAKSLGISYAGTPALKVPSYLSKIGVFSKSEGLKFVVVDAEFPIPIPGFAL